MLIFRLFRLAFRETVIEIKFIKLIDRLELNNKNKCKKILSLNNLMQIKTQA